MAIENARHVDCVGRIVIPANIRKILNISIHDVMEIFMDEDRIVLKKHTDSCVFCGCSEALLLYEGTFVCNKCLKKIRARQRKKEREALADKEGS